MKLEINHKKKGKKKKKRKKKKKTNMERLKIKSCIVTNKNDNTTYQKCVDAAKAELTGEYIALPAYLKKKINV